VSAAQALRAAREAGVQVEVGGDGLKLTAATRPPQDVVDDLKRHKAEVMALLRREQSAWTAEDWRAYFDERAGIAEYDGGLSRKEAEALAFEGCVAEWLDQHPVRSSPDWCLVCGRPEEMGQALLPVGVEPGGPAWLHAGCWERWYTGRRERAVVALETVGIVERRTLS
jgi:hypothetical protein